MSKVETEVEYSGGISVDDTPEDVGNLLEEGKKQEEALALDPARKPKWFIKSDGNPMNTTVKFQRGDELVDVTNHVTNISFDLAADDVIGSVKLELMALDVDLDLAVDPEVISSVKISQRETESTRDLSLSMAEAQASGSYRQGLEDMEKNNKLTFHEFIGKKRASDYELGSPDPVKRKTEEKMSKEEITQQMKQHISRK